MTRLNYKKLKGAVGVYKHTITGNYCAEKRVDGKLQQKTFKTLYEAKKWRKDFGNTTLSNTNKTIKNDFATLAEVWESIQAYHFPTLATSTKAVWNKRYRLFENIEQLPMNEITPSKITEWTIEWAKHFSTDEYQSGRGQAGRCNLNGELNMFVTIFNWYKESEQYEIEAQPLTCPIKRKHRKLGFIKPLPDKKKQIDLKHAFIFFEHLRPLYSDLAMMQFYTAGRVGEVSGMQWGNIDFDNKRMLIKHTCIWDQSSKMFSELKPFPKNRESRPVYLTDEILAILKRRSAFRIEGNDFVFHVEGKPLNYGTIQINYRTAQRRGKLPYSGTHILRHGMAKLARKVGGGLDAVIAMTGHKDIKLADHYSKCNEDDQKEFSQKIMRHIKAELGEDARTENEENGENNVISLKHYKSGRN
jgi:integrase